MKYVDNRNVRRYMRIDNFSNRLHRSKCGKSNSYLNNFGSGHLPIYANRFGTINYFRDNRVSGSHLS